MLLKLPPPPSPQQQQQHSPLFSLSIDKFPLPRRDANFEHQSSRPPTADDGSVSVSYDDDVRFFFFFMSGISSGCRVLPFRAAHPPPPPPIPESYHFPLFLLQQKEENKPPLMNGGGGGGGGECGYISGAY